MFLCLISEKSYNVYTSSDDASQTKNEKEQEISCKKWKKMDIPQSTTIHMNLYTLKQLMASPLNINPIL